MAQAGGPTFTSNVTSSSSNPDFILEDTEAGDQKWVLESDEPVDDAFSISYGPSNSTHPLVIESGAPENSLRINKQGKIGLGTSVPFSNLHIVNTGASIARPSFLRKLLPNQASGQLAVAIQFSSLGMVPVTPNRSVYPPVHQTVRCGCEPMAMSVWAFKFPKPRCTLSGTHSRPPTL